MNPFIIIGGCPRSGTTMVRNMLNSHPDVFIFPQTQFINKIWGARRLVNFKKNRLKMLQIIAEDAAVKRSGIDIFSSNRSKSNEFNDYFDEYLDFIRDYCTNNSDGPSFIGDKTPRHVMFVDLLKKNIQTDLKTIVIVRDSRAVIASMKARKLVRSIESGAAIWNFFCKHILFLLRRYSENEILLLKYEDIVVDPLARSKDISKFIGLDYNDSMVKIQNHNSSFIKNKKMGIFSDSLDIWKNNLSLSEINKITYFTKKYLEYFKYETSMISTTDLPVLSHAVYRASLIREVFTLLLMQMGLFPSLFVGVIKNLGKRSVGNKR
ncbi:sulfotransferase [Thermodesulfobacteriota bacterium]